MEKSLEGRVREREKRRGEKGRERRQERGGEEREEKYIFAWPY